MHKRGRLTEKQRYAIRLLTQFPVKKSYKEMAEIVGVSESTFRQWRNSNDKFIEALDARIDELDIAE